MAQLRNLIPMVKERTGGVIDKFALDHLKRAYQKFCTESKFLSEKVTLNQIGPNQLQVSEYHVFGGVNFVVDDNDNELKSGVDYSVSPGGAITVTKNVSSYSVFFYVSPSLMLPDDFEANDVIVNRWADYLADGAASSLMKMPNTAWTDLNISSYYSREFTDGYREAYQVAIEALDEQRPTQQRVFY